MSRGARRTLARMTSTEAKRAHDEHGGEVGGAGFSFDRLSGIAQEQIGYDPRSGIGS
jgi:hypothetical protein